MHWTLEHREAYDRLRRNEIILRELCLCILVCIEIHFNQGFSETKKLARLLHNAESPPPSD